MKKKYKILIVLSILVIITFGSGITYSLFNSKTTMSHHNLNIAKFVFNANIKDQIELPLVDLYPGITKEYNFDVSNNYQEQQSKVTIEYQITIKTYHLIPLTIKLYKTNNNTKELVLECDENHTRNDMNEIVCNGPIEEMSYQSKKLDNYSLKLEFPSQYNGEEYSNLVDYINLEIQSWQK